MLRFDRVRSKPQLIIAIALDLTNTKSFSAQYGCDEGDKLLRAFVDVLRKHFVTEACLRFSEDNFYVLTSEEGIHKRIENLFIDFKHVNRGKVLPVRVGVYPCGLEDDIVAEGFVRVKVACDLDRTSWDSHVTWFDSVLARRADVVDVSHDLLLVEFTESAASKEPEMFKSQVNTLREAGFKVWMDDFGSGYSSFNTLQNFDLDLIKLDMGFMSRCQDKKARDIIASVVQIARNLGISTLAEGVETEQQALYPDSIECDKLQGYNHIPPQPLETVIHRYKRLGHRHEKREESACWLAIGNFDLSSPAASQKGYGVDGSSATEFHAGIVEWRDGEWCFLRVN